jgi:hypothetical protein
MKMRTLEWLRKIIRMHPTRVAKKLLIESKGKVVPVLN